MNLGKTIIPKSDQLNADDLIAGPITITITAVESGSTEQPVIICYEGDTGRPYKPSKSMRRVLVTIWGTEGDAYIGQRLTLYRDPNVTFGSEAVGGIKISHATGLSEPVQIALTEKRAKRKPHRIEPMPAKKPGATLDVQALTDVGESKAREGSSALRTWWQTIPAGAAKTALKAMLDSTWKQLAESADAGKTAA